MKNDLRTNKYQRVLAKDLSSEIKRLCGCNVFIFLTADNSVLFFKAKEEEV